MALPHTITERGQVYRAAREHPALPQARGLFSALVTRITVSRAVLGLHCCFLGSPWSLQLGTFGHVPPSRMRAIRPNVDRGPRSHSRCASRSWPTPRRAGPFGPKRRSSRIATAGLKRRALWLSPSSQPFQSAQLQRRPPEAARNDSPESPYSFLSLAPLSAAIPVGFAGSPQ